MPSLTGTFASVYSETLGTGVTLSVTTPPSATGAVSWFIFWRGRAESGWKQNYAKLSASTLYTKSPLPSKRCYMFVRAVDSVGAVFDSTPFAFHPKDTATAKIFTQIIAYAPNLQLGEVGKQKTVAYVMQNGALALVFSDPARELDVPFGSGVTLTPTLNSSHLKDYANSAPVTGQEGQYRAGFVW